MRSPGKYRLRIDIGSTCDVISWYVLLSVFTDAEFRVGYINPKTVLNRAFVSLHFCSMCWYYIFNCVYYVLGIHRHKLRLDPYDYEHLIWPRLLLYYMWLMMWYTGLYTYNNELLNHLYWTYLLRVPTAPALNLHPRTKRVFRNIFTILLIHIHINRDRTCWTLYWTWADDETYFTKDLIKDTKTLIDSWSLQILFLLILLSCVLKCVSAVVVVWVVRGWTTLGIVW